MIIEENEKKEHKKGVSLQKVSGKTVLKWEKPTMEQMQGTRTTHDCHFFISLKLVDISHFQNYIVGLCVLVCPNFYT